MYVAVDGCDDELRALLRAALARELRAQHFERRFRGFGGFYELRQEYRAGLIVLAYRVERGDYLFFYDFHRLRSAFEQLFCGFRGFVFEAVGYSVVYVRAAFLLNFRLLFGRGGGAARYVGGGFFVLAEQDARSGYSFGHSRVAGVHYRRVEAHRKGHCQHRAVDDGAHRKAEGDVADAEDCFDAELFFDERERL